MHNLKFFVSLIFFIQLLSFGNIAAQEALTANTDRNIYAFGDMVTVSGTVTAFVEGEKGSIKVFNPKNRAFLDDKFTPDADGTYSYSFKLEGNLLEEGSWSMRISYHGNNKIISFTVARTAITQVAIQIVVGSSNANNADFFKPSNITVEKGTNVVWNNKDTTTHTVTSGIRNTSGAGSLFDSGPISSSKSFELHFESDGEYPYFCSIHPWMADKVTVGRETASAPITLNLSTDKKEYTIGDIVQITGKVSPVSDKSVIVQVFNPSNFAFSFGQLQTSNDGSFAYSFALNGDLAKEGDYTIRATYSNKTATAIIQVIEPKIPEPVPEPQASVPKISASDVSIVDMQGLQKNNITTGEQIIIQTDLTNNQKQQQVFAFVVQIKDAEEVTVMISWFKSTLNEEQTATVAQSWIPEEGGIFIVEAFVWEDLANPVPLTDRVIQSTIRVS
jgi:plastocyanin